MVFLSLIFLLLLVLVGAVVESASIQISKNEKRADASRAVESIFAEYQRDLLEQYAIFGLEGSYESGNMSEENVLNRLIFYGAENNDIDIIAIRYLTDHNGQEFYRQAVEFQKMKAGISAAESLLGKNSEWKEQEYLAKSYEKEDEKTDGLLQQILGTEKQELSSENNPLEWLKTLKSEAFLGIVMPKDSVISDTVLKPEQLVSKRSRREGRGSLYEKTEDTGDAVFFNLYLLERFGNVKNKKDSTYLKYELEYLLAGEMSDAENLENAMRKLCNVRFGINYAYLLSDFEMQAEAEVLAGTISALAAVPGLTPVMKQAILLTWAYGEAMLDVRTLLEGEKVPILKTEETWKLSVDNLIDITDIGLPENVQSSEKGLSYEEYLQLVLLAEKKETLTMRALDLIELNLINGHGKNFFRADACVTGAKFEVTCPIRRNINYRFQMEYQYH